MSEPETTNLASIPAGAQARVTAVNGDSVVARRLMEMGVVPGVSVRLVKSAPFGDPLEVCVLGYSLAMRRSEAAAVEVEV